MANVFDTAKYILEQSGSMSSMKLQKLCYYSQAWALVWDDAPLFGEDFQAWANGPVCPELFSKTQGKYSISSDDETGGDGDLSENQKDTIHKVLAHKATHAAQGPSQRPIWRTPGSKQEKGSRRAQAVIMSLRRKAWRSIMAVSNRKIVKQKEVPKGRIVAQIGNPERYYKEGAGQTNLYPAPYS